jgi:pimeloyl-ACP methyl ester carboxylesterase
VSGRPWRERFVHRPDGTRLYVRDRAREPLDETSGGLTSVLSDGIACDGFIWRYLADDLSELSSVVHWNYRGHGRSSAPGDPARVGMDALSDDLVAVRAESAGKRAVLFGHSLGCQVVLESYRQNPNDVAGIVLICGAPGRLTHTFKGSDALARALPALIERVERHPTLARAMWANLPPTVATRVALASGEVDAGVRPEDLLPYMEHVASLDLGLFLRMLAAVGEVTAEDMLATIAVPTLVIAGTARPGAAVQELQLSLSGLAAPRAQGNFCTAFSRPRAR